jgi:hypothetical protein
MFSVTKHQFWFLLCTATSNVTPNTPKMAGQRGAPDKFLPMSQASGQSDKNKILSGVSQSWRGDKLIKIVQYFSITLIQSFLWSTVHIIATGYRAPACMAIKSDQLQIQMMPSPNWTGRYAGPGALLQIMYYGSFKEYLQLV